MAALSTTFREALRRLGPFGLLKLLARKFVKRQRYAMILREVPKITTVATLRSASGERVLDLPAAEREALIAAADKLLDDQNPLFSFRYSLRTVERPWEYDPIEKKHWPARHYTEQSLHAADTPHDVKIVWEINRFVELPTLAQAAFVTRDARYAEEIERRILSWIDENPFAHSINWASALEIAIRIISWSVSLRLLQLAGFNVGSRERIRRSVYEQLRYLSADLSLDKVVPTNHLIGEAAGLFIGASLWDYPTAKLDREIASRILETEILRQTYPDGATREATSWYHQFVTGFFDLVVRSSAQTDTRFSKAFADRLALMQGYLRSMTFDGQLVRYGDADDGLPILLLGNRDRWLTLVLGEAATQNGSTPSFFEAARQAVPRVANSFLFVRGGEFGMGGAGYSSHAHDDLLSPIIFLNGLPIIADPGTYVYNGDPEERRKFRGADAHNGLVIGESTGARQRMNFGWHGVRPPASIELTERSDVRAVVIGSYGEWPWHKRTVELGGNSALIIDTFERSTEEVAHWWLHFDPRWNPVHQSEPEFHFEDAFGNRLLVHTEGSFQSIKLEHYDYSPSYRVKMQAYALALTAPAAAGSFTVHFQLNP